MSRDSSHTYVHLRSSQHADLFEEFTHPPASTSASSAHPSHPSNLTQNPHVSNPAGTADSNAPATVPGSFLPYEEIQLPQHLMPLNPEDEDDVVPDMHAAWGINAALNQGSMPQTNAGSGGDAGASRREGVWRDLGLERLVGRTEGADGQDGHAGSAGVGGGAVAGTSGQRFGAALGTANGARREGARMGLRFMR